MTYSSSNRMLPRPGNGLEILRSLRAAGVLTPTIFLTAKSVVTDRVEGLDAGADGLPRQAPSHSPNSWPGSVSCFRRGPEVQPAILRVGDSRARPRRLNTVERGRQAD